MIVYVVAVTLAVVATLLTAQYLVRRAGISGQQLILSLMVAAVIGAILFLTFTGRLHWIAAAVAAALPFLRRIGRFVQLVPFIRGLARQAKSWQGYGVGSSQHGPGPSGPGTAAPDRSHVQTQYLDMSLDHASGEMDGRVTSGRFAGRELSSLDIDELRELWRELDAADGESARLLETYLDRQHGDSWREVRASQADAMSRREALNVLGLEDPQPSRDDIIKAHRRLMQKLHPDHGGSDYLASKLNEAKALLMDESH